MSPEEALEIIERLAKMARVSLDARRALERELEDVRWANRRLEQLIDDYQEQDRDERDSDSDLSRLLREAP